MAEKRLMKTERKKHTHIHTHTQLPHGIKVIELGQFKQTVSITTNL